MNYTFEEFVKYKLDSEAQEQLSEYLEYVKSLEEENRQLERAEELNNEQISNARDLLENIENILDSETTARGIKKSIAKAIENSYFEL